jgi:hypothetical protein
MLRARRDLFFTRLHPETRVCQHQAARKHAPALGWQHTGLGLETGLLPGSGLCRRGHALVP